VAIFLAVPAERRALEEIAQPFTAALGDRFARVPSAGPGRA
jgi:hypothetical protein